MTKKHDELVEEVRLLWCEECADGPLGYEYGFDPEVDDPCATNCKDVCTERAKKVVTLILSAVRDGELALPGEAARTWSMEDNHLFAWMKGWIAQGVRSFIALRPLTGIGKEE